MAQHKNLKNTQQQRGLRRRRDKRNSASPSRPAWYAEGFNPDLSLAGQQIEQNLRSGERHERLNFDQGWVNRLSERARQSGFKPSMVQKHSSRGDARLRSRAFSVLDEAWPSILQGKSSCYEIIACEVEPQLVTVWLYHPGSSTYFLMMFEQASDCEGDWTNESIFHIEEVDQRACG